MRCQGCLGGRPTECLGGRSGQALAGARAPGSFERPSRAYVPRQIAQQDELNRHITGTTGAPAPGRRPAGSRGGNPLRDMGSAPSVDPWGDRQTGRFSRSGPAARRPAAPVPLPATPHGCKAVRLAGRTDRLRARLYGSAPGIGRTAAVRTTRPLNAAGPEALGRQRPAPGSPRKAAAPAPEALGKPPKPLEQPGSLQEKPSGQPNRPDAALDGMSAARGAKAVGGGAARRHTGSSGRSRQGCRRTGTGTPRVQRLSTGTKSRRTSPV